MTITPPTQPPAHRAAFGALLALALLGGARAEPVPDDPPGRVARVGDVVGSVSLEPAGSDTWVTDVRNRPLTDGDRLWADRESRADLDVGSTSVRLGSATGIGVLAIDDRTVQLELSAGSLAVHVRALAPEETVEIATPRAAVSILQPGLYRLDVGDGDNAPLWIAVREGQVAVTDPGHETTLAAGQFAEYAGDSLADGMVSALPPNDAFDEWVAERDRREDAAEANRYVSPELTGYQDLDDHGSWRSDDTYGPVWVPAVAVGWAPYRTGHWGWIPPWGWTWIDDAPWGFAPFHYGRWVLIGGHWGWAPGPRRYAPVYAPALVGWVGGPGGSAGAAVGGAPVGWFPLGWNEVYVPAYRVSNAYLRRVNVTNTYLTGTTIDSAAATRAAVNRGPGGRRAPDDDGRSDRHYANLGIAGAVTTTTRTAFTGAQPVATHPAAAPRGALDAADVTTAAPAFVPTTRSLGHPAATRPAPGVWARPVVARAAPPPPPPTFEAQRQAIAINGGRPVPLHSTATHDPPVAARARADVVRIDPAARTDRVRATPHPAARPTGSPGAMPSAQAQPAFPHPSPGAATPARDPARVQPVPAVPATTPSRPATAYRPAATEPTAPPVRPEPRAAPAVAVDRAPAPAPARRPTEAPAAEHPAAPHESPPPASRPAPREAKPAPEGHSPPPRESAPPHETHAPHADKGGAADAHPRR